VKVDLKNYEQFGRRVGYLKECWFYQLVLYLEDKTIATCSFSCDVLQQLVKIG